MSLSSRLRICISLALAGLASSVFAQMTLVPRDGGGYDIQNPDGTKTVTRMAPRPGGGYEIQLRDGATIGMLPRSGGGYEIRNRNGITTICKPGPNSSLVCDSSKKTGEKTDFAGNETAPNFRGATMTPGSRGTYEVRDRDGTTSRVTPGSGKSYDIHS